MRAHVYMYGQVIDSMQDLFIFVLTDFLCEVAQFIRRGIENRLWAK